MTVMLMEVNWGAIGVIVGAIVTITVAVGSVAITLLLHAWDSNKHITAQALAVQDKKIDAVLHVGNEVHGKVDLIQQQVAFMQGRSGLALGQTEENNAPTEQTEAIPATVADSS